MKKIQCKNEEKVKGYPNTNWDGNPCLGDHVQLLSVSSPAFRIFFLPIFSRWRQFHIIESLYYTFKLIDRGTLTTNLICGYFSVVEAPNLRHPTFPKVDAVIDDLLLQRQWDSVLQQYHPGRQYLYLLCSSTLCLYSFKLVQVVFKERGAYVDGLKRGEGIWSGCGIGSGRGGRRREVYRIKSAPSFLPLLRLCFLIGGRDVLWGRRFGFGCTNPLVSRCRTAGLGNGSSVVCDLHSLVACVVSLHCGCLTKPQVGGDTPSRSMLLRLRQKIKKGDLRKKDSTLKSC